MKNIIILLTSIIFTQLSTAQTIDYSVFEKTIYGRNNDVGHYVNIRGFKMYYEPYGEANRS